MNVRTILVVALVASSGVIDSARAQATLPAQSVSTTPIFSRRDIARLGLVLLGVATATQLDQGLAQRFQSPSLQGKRALQRTSAVGNMLGGPGLLMFTGGLYAAGRRSGRSGLADVGLHATEAILVSSALTGFLKFATGRVRPHVATGMPDLGPDLDELRPGRGGRGFTSFPSGHTTAAFAAASAITAELRQSHPRAARLAGSLLYGGATLVGLSRVYDNKHWASDVIMGATLGTFVGRRVVQYQHSRPGNRLDRWLLPTSVAPTQGGFSLGWSIPVR